MTHRDQTIAKLRDIQDIPTLPDCFLRVQQVIRHPDSGTDDLVDVISTDQAICAMVLKQANSPAFSGGRRSIASIHEAVTRLGMSEVSEITMIISLIHGFPLPTTANKVQLFWTHAFMVGCIADEIGKRIPAAHTFNRQMLFTAGLLHDIGRAIIGLRIDPDYFSYDMNDDAQSLQQEIQHYGIDHTEAGSILMELWGFSQNLIDTIAHYHRPMEQCELAAAIIHVANDIANEHGKRIASIDGAIIALKQGDMLASLDDNIAAMLQQYKKEGS